ncbi:uncharacterized protein EKO05_0000078 [Ascochyta rabiei]|uniref:Uncharacterized protein n=1 Tax=Didymella rabiei TaxID=5454 RepID=A0A163CGF6_DIDRA|nr:uncharacterized protein EKO05_0000078 [Ascochyta rabiei]KZM22444.1 hypothetical protein ST47_g6446 [Ascochyta rabiei]UPX09388.1 hypothetical protein EKO05_0000078 [Ascochyta rabiei]
MRTYTHNPTPNPSQRPSNMCTSYEFNYLRCQREVKRNCKHTDHFRCESGMCKDDDHVHATLTRAEKCPVHAMGEEKKSKRAAHKDRERCEWPETNCRPM